MPPPFCFFPPRDKRATHTALIAFGGLSSLGTQTWNLRRVMLKASSPTSKITRRSLIFSSLAVIPWSWRRDFFADILSPSKIPSSFRTSKIFASEPGAWHFGRNAFWRMMMPRRCLNSWMRFAKLDSDMSPSWHIWVALANWWWMADVEMEECCGMYSQRTLPSKIYVSIRL